MTGFLWTAGVLGLSAVFLVPWVSGALKSIVPSSVAAYLPSSETPVTTTHGIVSIFVFGALLAVVLGILGKFRIHARVPAI